jgi:hypothetical protein
MDVDFMITDTFEVGLSETTFISLISSPQQIRPKLVPFKTFEEAAVAVDEMFESTKVDADESGDESGDDDDRSMAEVNGDANTVDDQVSRIVKVRLSLPTILHRHRTGLLRLIIWYSLTRKTWVPPKTRLPNSTKSSPECFLMRLLIQKRWTERLLCLLGIQGSRPRVMSRDARRMLIVEMQKFRQM